MLQKLARYIFKVSAFALLFLVFDTNAEAALLYMDPPEASINRGDSITIAVRIDPDENECINTIDAVIKYDASIRAIDVSRGESILSIWVEDPVIDESAHTVRFAGGIPGGYCGRIAGDPTLTNIVAELVFRSPGFSVGGGNNPTASIRFNEATQVLLHDGFGTQANMRFQDASITLLSEAGNMMDDSWNERIDTDTIPPSDFEITLSRDDIAFEGKYFITFNSQDKQSGIDHYEVMEEPFEDFYLFKWGRQDAPWVRTESPYVLKDQSLNSTIRVRAIDKAGLERVVVYVPDVALRTISFQKLILISILGVSGLIILALAGFALWRRKQRLIANYPETTPTDRNTYE